jgi:hypothetical protein
MTRKKHYDQDPLYEEYTTLSSRTIKLEKQRSISSTDREGFFQAAQNFCKNLFKRTKSEQLDYPQEFSLFADYSEDFRRSRSTPESKGILTKIKECLQSIGEFISEKLSSSKNNYQKPNAHSNRIKNRQNQQHHMPNLPDLF